MTGRRDPVAAFDASADWWDSIYDDPGPRRHWIRSRMACALRLLGEGPGEVLDVGMGTGRLCAELDRRGWTVWGLDGSERMVALARERLPHASQRLVLGRGERLPFADETYDAVVATGVLGYTQDPAAFVRELGRVLKPGGRAVVASGNLYSPYRSWRRHVTQPAAAWFRERFPREGKTPWDTYSRPTTRRRLEQLLAGVGLDVEAVEYTGFAVVLDPLDRLVPGPATRLAEVLGGRRSPLRRLVGTQLVAAARKPGQEAGAPLLRVDPR